MLLTIEQIVKYIQYHTGDTLEEIANKTGYSRPYINNLKNAGKSHVELQAALVKAYPDLLQNVSADKMVLNIINEDQAGYTKNKKSGVVKESQLASMVIRNSALLTVILNNQAEMMAKADGKPVSVVLAALENAVQQTEEALIIELSGR